MIIVTGAAGFIGSAFIWKLNEMGKNDILAVDKMRTEDKWLNLRKRDYYDWCDRDDLFNWLEIKNNAKKVTAILHMGAISATTETDSDLLMKNNYEYSKKLWNFCTENNITYIYASSAATYGDGLQGYNDEMLVDDYFKLLPLNKYGYSKKKFDDWVLKQKTTPKKWAGVKFFNVYGPQEYHKGRMASMIFHTFNQFNKTGKVKLFKSHKKKYKDGEQLRDFVYIKDVVDMLYHCMFEEIDSGIYNIGTGKARSFQDLVMATVKNITGDFTLTPEKVIEFIPMPTDIREKYQYFTEANMEKLKNNSKGYKKTISTLEEGVADYVSYLKKEDSYL